MNKQPFLRMARDYAIAKGDDVMFCEVYTNYRKYMSIEASTWSTMQYLYGTKVANELLEQSAPAFI